jgi:uncharacterized protein (DUF302 family)
MQQQAIPMKATAYNIHRETRLTYERAVEVATEELKKEGFGVLTEIDVKATLKKKLDVDFPRYVILGACNPQLANKALRTEPDIGLLLPCNVVVSERASSRRPASTRSRPMPRSASRARSTAWRRRARERRRARSTPRQPYPSRNALHVRNSM